MNGYFSIKSMLDKKKKVGWKCSCLGFTLGSVAKLFEKVIKMKLAPHHSQTYLGNKDGSMFGGREGGKERRYWPDLIAPIAPTKTCTNSRSAENASTWLG